MWALKAHRTHNKCVLKERSYFNFELKHPLTRIENVSTGENVEPDRKFQKLLSLKIRHVMFPSHIQFWL